MSIGDNIKRFRKRKKLTQRELANLLGVKFTAVSAWETGRSHPLSDKVSEMARILEVTTNDIFGVQYENERCEKLIKIIKEVEKKELNDKQINEIVNFIKFVGSNYD